MSNNVFNPTMRSLWRPVLAGICLFVCGAGCIDRARVNANCEWTEEATFSLDLGNPTHQQHLIADAQLAEELAMRYGDSEQGQLTESYGHPGEQCFERLAAIIEKNHGVTHTQILDSLAQRSWAFDSAVGISFALLYFAGASVLYRSVRRRFAPDERFARVGAALLASVAISASGVQLFELWAVVWEIIRIGNDHLGASRGGRIPWSEYLGALFVAGVFLFWLSILLGDRFPSRASDLQEVHLR